MNHTINLDALASNIKRARQQLGMNQQQFADAMHVTRMSVNNYERGVHPPSLEFMIRLSDVTKVAIDELVDGTYEIDGAFNAAIERVTKDIKRTLSNLSDTL